MQTTSDRIGSIDEAFSTSQTGSSPQLRSWLTVRSQLKPKISENLEKYELSFDLPEVNKEDMRVSMSDGQLFIQVNKKFNPFKLAHTNWDKSFGLITRAFDLPEDAITSHFESRLSDGVLKVELFKVEKERVKEKRPAAKKQRPTYSEPRPLEL